MGRDKVPRRPRPRPSLSKAGQGPGPLFRRSSKFSRPLSCLLAFWLDEMLASPDILINRGWLGAARYRMEN